MDVYVLHLHALVDLCIALRLWFVTKTSAHTFKHNTIAYVMGLAAITTSLRIWLGHYTVVNYPELTLNSMLLLALIAIKGNLPTILK